jgi:outer membrane cobalamin receptor
VHQERETRVNIRGLDQTGPRSLLMVDGVRFRTSDGLCAIDPSIIPALALDRIDILADGASATYGSDAIAGVINIVSQARLRWRIDSAAFPDAGTMAECSTKHLSCRGGRGTAEISRSPMNGRRKAGLWQYPFEFHLNYTPWGLDNQIR